MTMFGAMSIRMMTTPSPPISSFPSTAPKTLPVRTIPGSYGWPLLGPISDRLDYFWFQGPDTFFRNRVEKNKSTVFRTNVPPCFPFFFTNPNVVTVLDVKSFSHLFDMDIVEKANVLVGDFMPSVDYTGGLRVCAYLDTSEPKHTQIKNFALDILKRSSTIWVPTLVTKLDAMWENLEAELSKSGTASYAVPLQQFLFSFLTKCIIGADTSTSPEIAENGYALIDTWLGFQLIPTIKLGFLQPLEEIFLHSFPYPSFIVQGGYNKLVNFVQEQGQEVIKRGETEFNLTTQEAIHNLLFTLGFNAFGGFSIFFTTLMGRLETESTKDGLQDKMRLEVRQNCADGLSFSSVKNLELVQSFVYETLRLDPPVPNQYARARKDFTLSSHDSAFEIKKGELLCGYQPLVMRDAKIFQNPEEFVADRFTGDGKELLNYLYWSNGPQTGEATAANKQCAAKDYVTLTATLFLAHLLLRYDSITISSGSITALEKAK